MESNILSIFAYPVFIFSTQFLNVYIISVHNKCQATTRRQAHGITGLWVDAAAVVVLSDEEVEAHWAERQRLVAAAATKSRKKKKIDGDEDGDDDDENDENGDKKEGHEEGLSEQQGSKEEDDGNKGAESYGRGGGGNENVEENREKEVDQELMKSEFEANSVLEDSAPEDERHGKVGDGIEGSSQGQPIIQIPDGNEADAINAATTNSINLGIENETSGAASLELELSGTGVVERSAPEASPYFPCTMCHKTFQGKNGLSKHFKKHHAAPNLLTTVSNSTDTNGYANDYGVNIGFNSENDDNDEFEDREEMAGSASESLTTAAPDGGSASRKFIQSGSSRFPFVQCLRRLVDLPGAVTWVAVQPMDVGNRHNDGGSSGAAADAAPVPHLPAFVLPCTHTHPPMGALMEQAGFRTQKYVFLRHSCSK